VTARGKQEFTERRLSLLQLRVLVTRHGKPAALIIGVEGEDFEDLMTRSDPKFWQMIEARRKASKTISAGEMRKRLRMATKPRPKRKH
jgi:antitoxin (DNA-binding transcriptional repressor) of toxin-antitoxin stability system